jgi:hypothetical protein
MRLRELRLTLAEHVAFLAQVTYTHVYGTRAEHAMDPTAICFSPGGFRAGVLLHREAMLHR